MSSPTAVQPSMEKVMSALMAYEKSAALKAAIELDVFTKIAEGAVTAQTIGERTGAAARGIRILCDFLTVEEFLIKRGDEYGLSPEGQVFLNRNSPAYVGSVAGFLNSEFVLSEFTHLTESVRKGGSAVEAHNALEPNHAMWVDFARSMAPMMAMPAQLLAEALGPIEGKVLDIAAGHGFFGIILAQKNPGAHIIALDWPNVLELASENAQKMGVADRFSTLPGSAFEIDLGTGYRAILLPNFLHHFDEVTNVALLKKVHAALSPGGQVAIVEFVPNEDRVSPPGPAEFSLVMLASTPAGDAYTFRELDGMLRQADFGSVVRHDLLPSPQTLIIGTK